MAKVYEVAFKIGAETAASFAKVMSSAGGALGELNKRMSSLGNQQAANKRVLDLRESLAKTSQEFNAAKQRVAELGAQMERSGQPTRAMTREYDQAQRAVERARGRMQQQAQTLREVSKEAGATGKSTAQLVAEQERLAKAGERASKAQAALQKNVAAQQKNLQQRSKLRGQLFDAVALTATLGAPVKVAMDFESAMSKVGAVSRASDEEMAALTRTARELGATTVWSASQAAEGMTYLGMAGFKTNEIIQTMPGMLNLASAAGADLGTTADIASNILSGFRLGTEEMGRVADVMVNTFTSSNTTLESLGQTMGYVAPIAAEAGVSLEQAAAMAGILGDNAIQGGKAGTALRAVINRLSGPPAAAADALKSLNMQVKDAEGNLRPLPDILTEVAAKTKDLGSAERLEIFKSIAGQEAGSAFAILVNEAAQGNLQNFAASVGEIGAAQRVSATMTDNARGAMIQFQSAMEAISITIGNVLLPVIADLATRASSMMLAFEKFANENPGLVKAIVLTTAGLMAFKIAAIAGGYAFTFIKGAALAARGAYLSTRTAVLMASGAFSAQGRAQMAAAATTKAMTAAQWLLNTAMLANPIGVVIAAVMGLVAAGAVLYKYWGVVAAFLKGAWQGLKEGLAPLFAALEPLAPLLDVIKTAAGWVADAFAAVIGWFGKTEQSAETLEAAAEHGKTFGQVVATFIKIATLPIMTLIKTIGFLVENWENLPAMMADALNAVKNYLSNFSLFEMGKKLLSTLTEGIKSAAQAPVEAIKGALAKVRDYLPFSDAKIGPLSELTYSGMQVMHTLTGGIEQSEGEPSRAVEKALQHVRNAVQATPAPVINKITQATGHNGEIERVLQHVRNAGQAGQIVVDAMPTVNLNKAINQPDQAITNNVYKQEALEPQQVASNAGQLADIMRAGMGALSALAGEVKQAASQPIDAARNALSTVTGGFGGFADRGAPAVDRALQLTVKQNITVNGGDGDVYNQAKRGASDGARDLIGELQRALAREGRLSYG